MVSYKAPSFQDRIARAADAKQKALDQLRTKPPADPIELARRREGREARDLVQAERRKAKAAAQAGADASREAAATAAPQHLIDASAPTPLTEVEKKAIRDARYVARKGRK